MKKIWNVIKNKYVIATLAFVLIICFFDENNLGVTHHLHHQVKELNAESVALRQGMEEDSLRAQQLKYDQSAIERYGRENYYMKRQDEDIYIINKTK